MESMMLIDFSCKHVTQITWQASTKAELIIHSPISFLMSCNLHLIPFWISTFHLLQFKFGKGFAYRYNAIKVKWIMLDKSFLIYCLSWFKISWRLLLILKYILSQMIRKSQCFLDKIRSIKIIITTNNITKMNIK